MASGSSDPGGGDEPPPQPPLPPLPPQPPGWARKSVWARGKRLVQGVRDKMHAFFCRHTPNVATPARRNGLTNEYLASVGEASTVPRTRPKTRLQQCAARPRRFLSSSNLLLESSRPSSSGGGPASAATPAGDTAAAAAAADAPPGNEVGDHLVRPSPAGDRFHSNGDHDDHDLVRQRSAPSAGRAAASSDDDHDDLGDDLVRVGRPSCSSRRPPPDYNSTSSSSSSASPRRGGGSGRGRRQRRRPRESGTCARGVRRPSAASGRQPPGTMMTMTSQAPPVTLQSPGEASKYGPFSPPGGGGLPLTSSPFLLQQQACNGGGSAGSSQTGTSSEDDLHPCHISIEERLQRSSSIWLLKDLQRTGAVHLLKDQEEGTFIVRGSSKTSTWAISVRLPQDKGPHIEHYLIETHPTTSSSSTAAAGVASASSSPSNTTNNNNNTACLSSSNNNNHNNNNNTNCSSSSSGSGSSSGTPAIQFSLEASENRFNELTSLIAYYSQRCDELPVQLRLPRVVREAKSRHDLASLAYLGQEFWGSYMASPSSSASPTTPADPPTCLSPASAALTPTAAERPNNLNFSSFGKGALSRDNSATNLSQFLSSPAATGIGGATKFSGSTASLVSCSSGVSRLTASSPMGEETKYHPARPAPAPPLPHTATTPVDRSSLVLNLDGSLEKSGFSSFRSQPTTPITPLRPTPPPRTSPPNTQQKQQHKPPPPTRTSRPPSFSSDPTAGTPVTILSPTVATASSTELLSPSCEVIRSGPTPPPRWARSNITVTTTLTLNVNQVAALPVQINDSGTPQSSGVQLQIAQLEIPVENRTSSVGSSRSSGSAGSGGGGSSGGGGGGCPASGPREGLQLHITQHIAPKSGGVLATHSTPCTPLTPSSDGADLPPAMTRSRLRAGPRDKRRHSNHYHEANIIDSPVSYHRSSLADKISDYEDVWSSPPRDLHTPSHESARTPTADRSHMTSFKPRCEFSKSLGDLTEISLGSKANVFSFDPDQQQQFAEESIYDNHHFNGVDDPNNRMSSSPFYAEPADALREAQQQQQNPKAAGIKKASSKLCRKVANRLSDSNIEWHKRTSRALMDKIESSEEVSNLASSSAENLVSSKRLESEKNEANVNGSSRGGGNGGDAGARRHSRAGRGKPVAPPRVGGPERDSLRDSMVTAGPSSPLPWKLDSSWRYHGGPDDSDSDIEGFYDAHREGRFPLDGGGLSGGVPSGGGSSSGGGENESITTPGRRTVQDLITERLPNLSMPDAQSLAPSCATRVSEYDNVGEMMLELVAREERRLDASPIREARGGKRDVAGVPGVTKKETQASRTQQSHYYPSTVSDSGTEFSEPWDSKPWMSLLRQAGSESVGVGVGGGVGGGDRPSTNGRSITPGPPTAVLGEGVHLPEDSEVDEAGTPFPHTDTESLVQGLADSEVVSDDDDDDQDVDEDASVTNLVANMPQPCAAAAVGASSHLDSHLRHRIMSPQRLARQHRQDAESGGAIRKYAIDLGSDQSTTFSQAVSNFITCTKESPERDPHRVVQNIRQFMSGMKNYLVTSGEKEFEATVKKERSNLKSTEFLNLDAILEDVLVRLALCPLWEHINNLFVEAYTANKSIQSLATNMKYARSQHYTRLGIKAELTPPHGEGLDKMKSLLTKMQQVYAPRQKLEYLLETVSLIYQSMYQNGSQCSVDADDLVPMIMWVLCHCHFVSAEVEAEYMWGLLLTSFSSGEASYYLTAFSSAINAVKNLTPSPESSPGNSLDSVKDVSMVPDHGVMKIVIPDEKNGSIVTRTLPIRPGTTTREVCKMMAHKMRVTNPQDYGLYKLVDGRESLLGDLECPHKVKWDLTSHGFHCTFAFKRTDAKIAWPFLTD